MREDFVFCYLSGAYYQHMEVAISFSLNLLGCSTTIDHSRPFFVVLLTSPLYMHSFECVEMVLFLV